MLGHDIMFSILVLSSLIGPRYVTETMLFLQFNHNFCFIASVDIVCFLRYSTKYMIILT